MPSPSNWSMEEVGRRATLRAALAPAPLPAFTANYPLYTPPPPCRVLGAALLRLSSSLSAVLPPLPEGTPRRGYDIARARPRRSGGAFSSPANAIRSAGSSFSFVAYTTERTPAGAGGFWVEEENPAAAGVALPEGARWRS